MTHYLNMTKKQAETALQEFLDERDPALTELRSRLEADSQDAGTLLDGTPESLVPLWGWALSQLKSLKAEGTSDPATVPRDEWPSWARYSVETEPLLSFESLRLVDGVISYLAQVVKTRAPAAHWQIGQYPNKRYQFRHHPVLAANDHQVFFPATVATKARRTLQGATVPEDALAVHAEAVIEAFGPKQDLDLRPDEPIVEVEDLGDDPRRGRELELGFREDIASEHSNTVDRLAKELKTQDGITGVLREDREVLLVATPTWTTSQLENWATDYLQKHIPELDTPQR